MYKGDKNTKDSYLFYFRLNCIIPILTLRKQKSLGNYRGLNFYSKVNFEVSYFKRELVSVQSPINESSAPVAVADTNSASTSV